MSTFIAPPCPPASGTVNVPLTTDFAYVLCDPTTLAPVEVRFAVDGPTGAVTGPFYFDPTTGVPVVPTGALIDCNGAQARCQDGCDYQITQVANVNGLTATMATNSYLAPGDSRFELRLDLAAAPPLLVLIQNWIAGGIQAGDFLFVDSTWLAPSVTTGSGFVIGEWMLRGSIPDVLGTEVRFLLDLNVDAPCDLAQFPGFTFDISDISAAWLYALAQEQRDNPGYLPGPRPIVFNGTATLSRAAGRDVQIVKLCDSQPIRVDQQPVTLQMDVRDISGTVLDVNTLDATSVTITVSAGTVLAGRGTAPAVALPPGQYTWGIDAARGILLNSADNAVAATQRGFTFDAVAGTAIVHWTWQVSP